MLVDPASRYRAKLTDFGTSAAVRQVLAGTVVGTPHAMAPEALAAASCFRAPAAAAVRSVEPRAVDVYAYGILLHALWDGGQEPTRHVPVEECYDAIAALPDLRYDRQAIALLVFQRVTADPKYGQEGLRPPPPPGMPPFFRDLMTRCVRKDPEARPSFWAICESLKARFPPRAPPAPAAPPGDERWRRVTVAVRYLPAVARSAAVAARVTVAVARRDAPLGDLVADFNADAAEQARSGTLTLRVPFAALATERITLTVRPSPHAHSELGSVGSSEFAWAVPQQPPAPPALLDGVALPALDEPPLCFDAELHIAWDAAPSALPALSSGGVPASVMLCVTRHGANGEQAFRSLGLLSLLLGATDAGAAAPVPGCAGGLPAALVAPPPPGRAPGAR